MIKKVIQYYYDLYPEHVDREKGNYTFEINNTLYYFEQQRRSEEELNIINQINKNLHLYNWIVPNKFQKLISNYGNRNYILIQVIKPIRDLKPEDVLTTVKLFSNRNNEVLLRTGWSVLWEKKIDNIEYQQQHIVNRFPLIDQSLGYYIGMSETAIAYFMAIDKSTIENHVAHIRINVNKNTLDFFNPQNIVIDNRSRDIAEYLKSLFINNCYNYKDIALFLEKAMANDLELKLVFCRLNYPSFYFDLYEKVINQQIDESRLDTVIKRNEEYREFLKNIYYIMNKKTKIKNIEWITK